MTTCAACLSSAVGCAAHRHDAVPMPCAETMLAIDALESAEALVADLRIPDVIDVEALADTWPAQWRSLVEADPATLTAGAVRRRDAMVSIAAYVRATRIASPTRAERIEAAARAVVAAHLCGCEGDPPCCPECSAVLALRAALCSCTAHGPDLACVEHGEALRAWQKRNAP